MTLLSADGSRQLWSGSSAVPLDAGFIVDSLRLHSLVNQAAAAAGHHIGRLSASHEQAVAYGNSIEAVGRMFKVDAGEVAKADALLSAAYEIDPRGIFLAWRAYARTFYLGEHSRSSQHQILEEAEALARSALEQDPHNSSVLALTSYVYSFALKKFAAGHELASQSVRGSPSHPLGNAFLGRAKSYLGRHDEGYQLACRGRELSGHAPYTYKLHFLCGVTALLAGRLDEALQSAEIASAMAPTYRAPQRCVIPLYLQLEQRAKAKQAYERLRQIEPSFTLDGMKDPGYPSAAIRESGLSKFSEKDL